MPNKNSSLKKQNPIYNSGDLYEAYSLAYEQMADTSTMLGAISNEFKNLKDYLSKVYDIPDSCFNDLKRIIAITNTMIQESADFNQNLEQQYQNEYEESQA
ncbi:hypothetical protein [Acinetobacter kanungonis]|uniref:hypothetical protein n=1 Tax=Acinetobacter kanungonis TaxID=2699469 RepID=UPI00137AEC5E|nr:hypothetical protein [Acinetobacter kanungonis]NCI78937.1 hypothetical protein [Acinetobacter kanungonis]